MIGHAVLLVVIARGWFFTGDDWDYLTRDGLGNVFDPHNGHITAIIAGLAVIARGGSRPRLFAGSIR